MARRPYSVPISCAGEGLGLDMLLARMWDAMGLVRVFTKRAGGRPDFSGPVVLSADRGGTRVADFCDQIHKSLRGELNYALVWGASAKHAPQRVGVAHRLADEDVIQAVKRKVKGGEDGRGRFKAAGSDYVRLGDREKKKALRS